MNIVLIGYRGTGKSHVGQLVAKELGLKYVGMDAEIVRRAGMSIPEIVEQHDWPTFRDMESELARDLAGQDGLLIDTGGGVIERPENIVVLQQGALIFWLKASVATIVSRIEGDTQRPALVEGKTFTEEVAEVLERRTSKYQEAAQYEVETDTITPQEVAERIVEVCRSKS